MAVPVRRPVPERILLGKDADASVPRPYTIGSPPGEAGDEVGDRRGIRAGPFAREQEDEYSAQRACRARTPRRRRRARAAAGGVATLAATGVRRVTSAEGSGTTRPSRIVHDFFVLCA